MVLHTGRAAFEDADESSAPNGVSVLLSRNRNGGPCMAWHGMAWHGMAWHGMAWHGMAESKHEQALRHVTRGREIVARQVALVAHMQASKWPTGDAEEVLRTFQTSLAIFENDLAALESETEKLGKAAG